MQFKLAQHIWQWRTMFVIAPGIAIATIAIGLSGILQLLEWATLDWFFRIRPQEPPDPRIVLVTIDESDLDYVGRWPIPDIVLAKALATIQAQNPRVIGVDIYRNLPVPPGRDALNEVFRSSPNLVGIEKFVGEKVPPDPILQDLNQVALADLVVDADGKVRRALMSIRPPDGEQIRLSLAARLATMYLEQQGVELRGLENGRLGFGKAVLVPFQENDGGYIRADNGGYQLLLNYRGHREEFQQVSLHQVLTRQVSPNLMRDRIVLIGGVAESLNDLFHTPYTSSDPWGNAEQMSGLAIHANAISQIVSAALDGRPLIRVWSEPIEWLWVLLWSLVGVAISEMLLDSHRFRRNRLPGRTALAVVLLGGVLVGSTYSLFLSGWWIPTIAPLIALSGSAIATSSYKTHRWQRLASLDSLTQVANRRCFDEYLNRQWYRNSRNKRYLSIVLCDVDCFKLYNDTYGHQAGDACLQQVAQAICYGVRRTDFVARYGGEEFVAILPDTDADSALEVAQRIRDRVKALRIEHARSTADRYVTLSCGVATTTICLDTYPSELILCADRALYEAKSKGRDRVILAPNSPSAA